MMKTFCRVEFSGASDCRRGSRRVGQVHADLSAQTLARGRGHQGLFSEWNSSELVKSATSKGKKRELLTPTTFSLIHATILPTGMSAICCRCCAPATWSCATVTFLPRSRATWCADAARMGARHLQFRAQPDLTFFFRRTWKVAPTDSRRPAEAEIFSRRAWTWGCRTIPTRVFASSRAAF